MTTNLVRIGHCQNGSQGRMGDEFPFREGICKSWGGKAEPPSTPATQPEPIIGPMISIHISWPLWGAAQRFFFPRRAWTSDWPVKSLFRSHSGTSRKVCLAEKYIYIHNQKYGRAHQAPTFRSWATHRHIQVLQAANRLPSDIVHPSPPPARPGLKYWPRWEWMLITTLLSGLPLGTLPRCTREYMCPFPRLSFKV